MRTKRHSKIESPEDPELKKLLREFSKWENAIDCAVEWDNYPGIFGDIAVMRRGLGESKKKLWKHLSGNRDILLIYLDNCETFQLMWFPTWISIRHGKLTSWHTCDGDDSHEFTGICRTCHEHNGGYSQGPGDNPPEKNTQAQYTKCMNKTCSNYGGPIVWIEERIRRD